MNPFDRHHNPCCLSVAIMTSQARSSQHTPWIVLMAALWAQVFYCASYGWLHALYYDYGWYVPPLAVWFFYRKQCTWKTVQRPHLSRWVIATGFMLLTAALVPLRTFLQVDPGWPTPLWAMAGIASAVTLISAWRIAGRTAAIALIPVLLFALTAVRLPTMIESVLVDGMTQGVLATSSWIFQRFGIPMIVVGNQLELLGKVVEVSEGCSGIRSAQSFLMASLCFGEWLRLNLKARVNTVVIALLTAWVMNVARACTLAEIRFNQGESAFEEAHDPVGIAAFVLGAGILLWVSMLMDGKRQQKRVVRQRVESNSV